MPAYIFTLQRSLLAEPLLGGILVALVLLCCAAAATAPRGAADPQIPATRSGPPAELLGTLAVAGAGWFLAFWPAIAAHGVPVMRHDWTWPVDREEAARLFGVYQAPWVLVGLGVPKGYPTLYPYNFAISALATIFDAHQILAILTLVLTFAATFGMQRMCAKTLGAGGPLSIAAAAFFGFAPFVMDKFVAGHLPNLIGYAALPYLVMSVDAATMAKDRGAMLRRTIEVAVLIAVSASQIQYLGFDIFLLAAFVTVCGRPRHALFLALAALLAASLFHIQSISHLLVPHAVAASQNADPDWLAQLSTSEVRAFAMDSYAAGYARQGFPAWIPLALRLAVMPLTIVAVAASLSFVRGVAALPGIAATIGLMGITGVNGPFSGLRGIALTDVPPLAVFREFYNFEALVAFGLAGAVAIALSRIGSRRLRGTLVWLSCAVLFVQTLPLLSGAAARELVFWSPGSVYASLARVLGPGGERIAILPLTGPLQLGDVAWGGTDPFSAGFRGHPTLVEWSPDQVDATLAVLSYRDPAAFVRLAAAAGIEYVILRRDVRSVLSKYWRPELFPRGWEQPDYASLRAQAFESIAEDQTATLLKNMDYRGIVQLGDGLRPCFDAEPMLDVARNACRHRSDARNPTAPRSLAVPVSNNSHNPELAWTRPAAAFFMSPAIAGAPANSAVTIGANVLSFGLDVRADNAHLLIRCRATEGLAAFVDGSARGHAICRGPIGEEAAVVDLGPVPAGRRRVVIVNRSGPALLSGLGISDGSAPPGKAFSFLSSFPAGDGTLDYERKDAASLSGSYWSPGPASLLFSDAYDPDWTLSLDGGDGSTSSNVNDFENGWPLPAGRHRFALDFRQPLGDRALGDVQLAMWPLCALGYAFLTWRTVLRSRTN